MDSINVGGLDVSRSALEAAFAQPQAASQQPQQEIPETVSATVTEGEPGILDTILDAGKGLIGGALDAVNETTGAMASAGDWLDEKLGTTIENGPDFMKPGHNPLELPSVDENITATGKVVRNLSQFATGFVGAGKFLEGAKLLQVAGKATSLARSLTQGAMADGLAMNPWQEGVSALIEEHPELSNPISRYFNEKPGSEAEARFKNVLAGLGFGAATEGIFAGVRALKAAKGAKTGAEAERIITEAGEQLAAHVKVTDDEVVDAVSDSVADLHGLKTQEAVPPASPKGEGSLDLKALVDKARNPDELTELVADSVNLKRTVFDSPEPLRLMKEVSDELYSKTLKGAGPEAHATIAKESALYLEKAGFDDMVSSLTKHSDNLQEVSRELYAARTMLALQAKESVRLGSLIDSGRATMKDMAEFHAMSMEVEELHKAVANVRTGSGRLLRSQGMDVDMRGIPDSLKPKHSMGEAPVPPTTPGVVAGEVPPKVPTPEINPRPRLSDVKKMSEAEAAEYLSKNSVDMRNLKQMTKFVAMTDGDVFKVARLLNAPMIGNWTGVASEYWINCILSSYRTQGANLVGNAVKAMTMPAEKIVGGMLHGNKDMILEGMGTYMGMKSFLGESFRMAHKAFKANANILDAAAGTIDTATHQMSYENLKGILLTRRMGTITTKQLQGEVLSPWEEITARGISYLGKVVGIPSRVLMSTDEFFKQLNFRSDLYARIQNGLIKQHTGANLAPEELASMARAEMSKYINEGGRAIDFNLVEGELKGWGTLDPEAREALDALKHNSNSALRYAQEATWTQPLQYGIGQSLQKFKAEHPAFSFVVPFVRTPTNIIRDFVAHTPGLANLTRRYQTAIATGGEAAAMAHGQLATGSMLWATAATLAASGHITGAPPKDAKLAAMAKENGWQPWSLKIGDKYYSYRRFDPVGMFLGMAADINRIINEYGTEHKTVLDTCSAAVIAAANNLTSKTYLQGLTEVFDALSDPDAHMESLIKSKAASFLPLSSLLRTVRQDFADPHMREVRSLTDHLMNQVPGFSDDLPTKFNWVTGKATDYHVITQDQNDAVIEEMANRASTIIGGPPRTLRGGVELTGAQYSRLNELHGTVKIGGKTMYQRLSDLFASEGYDKDRQRFGDAPFGQKGPRDEAINSIVTTYRKVATSQLLKESPDLVMTMEDSRRKHLMAKAGRDTANPGQTLMGQLMNF